MKICIVIGTRPEIIKVSSLISLCEERRLDYFVIHSNQHYSENMDKIFFEDLRLPYPKYNLHTGSGSHGNQTGDILIKIEKIILEEKPDIVLVQGDTNTVLAGALAGSKLGCKIGHIEAGLRSYDRSMPEETNRIVVDHISDYLFAPTEKQRKILIQEGIEENKIHVVGNTVVDAVNRSLAIAVKKSDVLNELDLRPKKYFLITAHRAGNVDIHEKLERLISIIGRIAEKYEYKLVYPVHPRTMSKIKEFGLDIDKRVKVVEPKGYFDFLTLEKNAKLIITDSGGIQEEACVMKVPCITIRENTERPETVEIGANILVGLDVDKVLEEIGNMLGKKAYDWENPFGDGKTAERILDVIRK